MADLIPTPVLSPDVLQEYVYGNFIWPEIREWLLPQISWARRIVLFDGTELGVAGQILRDPLFPKERMVGLWDGVHGSGNFGGVPFLASDQAVFNARPDLLLTSLLTSAKAYPNLTALHIHTRAPIFQNLMYANPFSGSMMIWKAEPGEPSNIFSPNLPPPMKESVLRHMGRYLLFSGWAKDREVLDIACGNGYGTHLLSRVARRVTGVDLNVPLVAFARKRNAAPNIRYLDQDLLDLPKGERYDVITSVETFEHIPTAELDAFVGALKGFLNPGGTLLCTTPLAAETVRNPVNREHIAEYSNADFVAALSTHFRVQGVFFQQQDGTLMSRVPEGMVTPQSGDPAHIVQIAVATPR